MKHLGDLLSDLPLPDVVGEAQSDGLCEPDPIFDLSADLPAGHLHLWGGPAGAGKTCFLLNLLFHAAVHGRRCLYVTYHLSAQSLAIRLLGIAASLDTEAIATSHLTEEQAARAAGARACLSRLPIHVLEARGCSVASIEDRLVRMPFRAEVAAVDYLQAVVRDPGAEIGSTVRALSSLASRLHVSVVAAIQAKGEGLPEGARLADRAGWIAPAGGSGLRRAEVIQNRYGARPAVPLRLDKATGALRRLDDATG
jgi:hypothetical protein